MSVLFSEICSGLVALHRCDAQERLARNTFLLTRPARAGFQNRYIVVDKFRVESSVTDSFCFLEHAKGKSSSWLSRLCKYSTDATDVGFSSAYIRGNAIVKHGTELHHETLRGIPFQFQRLFHQVHTSRAHNYFRPLS